MSRIGHATCNTRDRVETTEGNGVKTNRWHRGRAGFIRARRGIGWSGSESDSGIERVALNSERHPPLAVFNVRLPTGHAPHQHSSPNIAKNMSMSVTPTEPSPLMSAAEQFAVQPK